MSEGMEAHALPDAHVGIDAGPVVSPDGPRFPVPSLLSAWADRLARRCNPAITWLAPDCKDVRGPFRP